MHRIRIYIRAIKHIDLWYVFVYTANTVESLPYSNNKCKHKQYTMFKYLYSSENENSFK